MFERSLSALIKGLRSHRGKDESKYVALILDEIRHEVRSGDLQVKAEAILKLTYLQMLGYPFSGANFHVLETMASSKYHHKHVGYLAAAQCFSADTDVLILSTNMIKKDLQSSSPLDVAVALNGLSHIATPDLATHLGPDVIKLLTHSKAMVRKKALLVLYSLIIKSPDLLETSWERLREKLEDVDLGVVSAAVNIVCELARRDARPFLPLSPQLFRLLTTSTNNWMLIKIIKLFGSLTPLEPRLVKKLVPRITTIISTTPAMSLLYECIHTIIIGGMLGQPGTGDELAYVCVEKLAGFLTDTDQNLKYIALLALVKILPTHPALVAEYQEVIFESIEDEDLSIRLRALELVSGMAVRRNLESIVQQLMSHLEPRTSSQGLGGAAAALKASLSAVGGGADADPTSSSLAAITSANNPTVSPSYRLEIVERILALGSYDTYANVSDFNWYLDTLLHLSTVSNLPDGNRVGSKIRDQLIDITARVRAIRPHAARTMISVLRDGRLLPPSSPSSLVAAWGGGGGVGGEDMKEARKVLHACAWILGEYAIDLPSSPSSILPLLLQPQIFDAGVCDPSTAAACVHGAVKMYAFWASALSARWSDDGRKRPAELAELLETTKVLARQLQGIPGRTMHPELGERAVEYRQLFLLIEKDLDSYIDAEAGNEGEKKQHVPPRSLDLLSPLFFNHALGPLGANAQSKVPEPVQVDLHSWIVPTESYVVLDSIHLGPHSDLVDEPSQILTVSVLIPAAKTSRKEREARLQKQREDAFYIVDSALRRTARKGKEEEVEKEVEEEDVDKIPIVRLDDLLVADKKTEGSKVEAPVLEQEEMPEPVLAIRKKKKAKKTAVEPEEGDAGTKVVRVKKKDAGSAKKSVSAGVVID
ncbi:related to Adapter-related protein complex 3 delta 1 subunit [Ustilago sp. UG-2017b]|nr:related to Adapter-related protein complex 3 delta 1 subunit [Ustilago sp. UG-2017b]